MTPAIHFREGVRGDRDAILALRVLAFPDDDREKLRPDFWDWEFVDGYAGPGRFFVAEAGDRIVAHFGFVPQRYAARDMVLRGALAVDVMTHPEFRRQKVFSGLASFAAARLRKEFQIVTAFQIRESVMGGMQAGGWHAALHVPVLLKPLSLRGIVRDFGLRFGIRTVDERSEPAGEGVGNSIRPIRAEDFEQIDAFLAASSTRQIRSAEFLAWRYRRNPHWHYELAGFFEGSTLRAFLVHRDSILRGLRSLAIADAGAVPGGDEPLRLLMRHVCRAGRRRGLSVAAALMSRDHAAYRGLRRNGFMRGPHRFRLLLQVFDESLRWIEQMPWSLSWGDTDHL